MFQFRTDTIKKIQAAAILLQAEKNRMDRIRLLKLLYIADREALKEIGKPIIGGRVVAMKNGPLHSEVYDLIKGQHEAEAEWSNYFENDGHTLTLTQDPGRLDLSPYEIEKLCEVSSRYASMDSWAVADETHYFQEYIDSYQEGTSTTIPQEKILSELGFTEEEIAATKSDAETHAHFLRSFGG